MPKVSIIMGVYNGAHRMDKSIQSIINQTFKDWEFIICDDGSSDGSFEKLQEYAKKDSRIIALKNPKNAGLAQTLNNCLSVAKGQLLYLSGGIKLQPLTQPFCFSRAIRFPQIGGQPQDVLHLHALVKQCLRGKIAYPP